MKKMKLTKKNKKELKMICGVLIFFAVIFIWIVQNIGLPIKTQVEKGRIKVIDISSYNGTVNWKKVKDHNVNHAMIKIGSGMNEKRAGRKDSKFDTNFRNAGYASIHRGVYYYSYAKTTSDAKKEARHCLKLLKEQGIDPTDLDLPVAFDIEEKAVFQTGRRNVTAVTTTFCDEIKKAGFEPMVYSGASALRNYFEYSKIREYKIWVAHYTKASAPAIPFSYDMWQYTSRAVINGANTGMGYCDLNYYLVDKNVQRIKELQNMKEIAYSEVLLVLKNKMHVISIMIEKRKQTINAAQKEMFVTRFFGQVCTDIVSETMFSYSRAVHSDKQSQRAAKILKDKSDQMQLEWMQ